MPTGGALRAGALALAPSVHGRGVGRAWMGSSGTPCLSRAPPPPQRAHPSMENKQKAKKQQGKMPKKGGKRGAQSRDAGAKGGRPKKKPAAADAVLQQPAAPQPPAKKALLGRSGRTPLLECTDLTPWREGASFVFNALFPLFALYAPSKQSREARPCVFSMQCLLLE